MKVKQIKQLINQNLKVGDSQQKIEDFMKGQGWPFEYDEYAGRYQSHDPKGFKKGIIVDRGIGIWIYVDESKNFKKAVVETIGSGL